MPSSETIIIWIYNSILLFLWIYIGSSFGKDVFYNLFVNRTRSFLTKPVLWVQSLFPRCKDWVAAALMIVALLALRVVLSKASNHDLSYRLGHTLLKAYPHAFWPGFLFCTFSFCILISQANLLYLFLRFRRIYGAELVTECLETVSKPFSLLRPRASLIVTFASLLLATSGLVWCSSGVPQGSAQQAFGMNPLAISILFPIKGALLAAVGLLPVISGGIMVLIIVSLVSLALRNLQVMNLTNVWLNTLSRSLFPHRIGFGPLDFTPLILYYILNFVSNLLEALLESFI